VSDILKIAGAISFQHHVFLYRAFDIKKRRVQLWSGVARDVDRTKISG
jgi:hypothetical protein